MSHWTASICTGQHPPADHDVLGQHLPAQDSIHLLMSHWTASTCTRQHPPADVFRPMCLLVAACVRSGHPPYLPPYNQSPPPRGRLPSSPQRACTPTPSDPQLPPLILVLTLAVLEGAGAGADLPITGLPSSSQPSLPHHRTHSMPLSLTLGHGRLPPMRHHCAMKISTSGPGLTACVHMS